MPVVQKLPCEVAQVIDHGGQVYSLELIPERPAPRFQPGQFLHLAIDPYEPGGFWPDSRVFSIASSPEDRHNLRITYSVRGKYTARMEEEIKPGKQVWVKLPYGEFVIHRDRPAVLFAGGTGVTAFTAFIESLPVQPDQCVTLFYGARNRDLLIYRHLIDAVAHRCPYLIPHYYIELSAFPKTLSLREVEGRLSVSDAWHQIENPLDAYYYLSGPPLMISSLKQELLTKGVAERFIFIDAW